MGVSKPIQKHKSRRETPAGQIFKLIAMEFIKNAFRRILVHWQSSLFGLAYLALLYLLVRKEISMTEWAAGMGTLLTVKGIFLNKDPDKVPTKDEYKAP